METMPLTIQLPVAEIRFLERYAQQQHHTISEVIDQYVKQLQRSGVTPKGVAGKHLIRFAGAIPLDDLEQMKNAIDAECERVDEHEW